MRHMFFVNEDRSEWTGCVTHFLSAVSLQVVDAKEISQQELENDLKTRGLQAS